MAKSKYCDVGKHNVDKLWKARKRDPNTREITQPSCCKSCLVSKPISSNKKASGSNKELDVFFAEQSLVFPNRCENCGEYLDRSSAFSRRSQTCHILPKSIFKSVQVHPSNKIFMCCFSGCYGHGNWDNLNAEKRKSMPVYQLAIERFRSFENSLTEAEKIKAYKYLGLSDK